jgi:hypothetical protein
MPIIPRFEQNFDPNQPPRMDFGERFIGGVSAGAQAQRSLAEADYRRQMAGMQQEEMQVAREKRAKSDELERAMVIAQQMDLSGQPTTGPRPEQFAPQPSGLGANAAYTAETMGYGGIPAPSGKTAAPLGMRVGGAGAAPFVSSTGLVSNFSPTKSPSVVPMSRMKGMADLDAQDREEMDAVMRVAREQGFGPTGTNALLQAARGRSLERRQMFDVQQSQDAYQNALVGLERMSADSPALKEAMTPALEQLKIQLDQLDDNIDPEERNLRIRAFNDALNELNGVARKKRAQIKNYETTLATVGNILSGYAPENPNFEMWTDVQSELMQNPDMDIEQIGDLMRTARLEDQGYKQDPFTGGWFTEKVWQDRMDDRRKQMQDMKRARQSSRAKQYESWISSQPDDGSLATQAKTAYEAQFTDEDVYSLEAGETLRKRVPVVDTVRSYDEILNDISEAAYDRWEQNRPVFGGKRKQAAAAAGGFSAEAINAAVEAEVGGKAPSGQPAYIRAENTAPVGPDAKLPTGPTQGGKAVAGPSSALWGSDEDFLAAAEQAKVRREEEQKKMYAEREASRQRGEYDVTSPKGMKAREVPMEDLWALEREYGEVDPADNLRFMLGMNPANYEATNYQPITREMFNARRAELEREAEQRPIRSQRNKEREAKRLAEEEAKRASDESKARADQYASQREGVRGAIKEGAAQGEQIGREYQRRLQEKSSKQQETDYSDRRHQSKMKARADLQRILGVDDLSNIGLNNRVKNALFTSRFEDQNLIDTLLASGLYNQKDIDDARAEYMKGKAEYTKAKGR